MIGTIFKKGLIKGIDASYAPLGHSKYFQAVVQAKKDKIAIRSEDDLLLSHLLKCPLKIEKGIKLEQYLKELRQIPEELQVDKVLIWDTETTGLKGYVVSIALVLYSIKEQKVLQEVYEIVNPLEKIEEDAFKVHKISQEEAEKAETFEVFWSKYSHFFEECDMMTGQNLIFDIKVLDRELERLGFFNPIPEIPYFDTMNMLKDYVKFKDKNGKRVKNPKLEELISFFGIDLKEVEQIKNSSFINIEKDGYHNALVDVIATLEVFKKTLEIEF